jgi:phosphoribosylamine-glycine ligase
MFGEQFSQQGEQGTKTENQDFVYQIGSRVYDILNQFDNEKNAKNRARRQLEELKKPREENR